VNGYLGERLLGAFYLYQRDRLDVLELPRVHFDKGRGKQVLYHFLPPGTKRRAAIKHLCKG